MHKSDKIHAHTIMMHSVQALYCNWDCHWDCLRILGNKYIIVGLESGDVFILKGEDDNSDYTLKKYVIQQNKVIQVTDAENKFVLFHEKDFGKIIQVRYKWKESWNESFS